MSIVLCILILVMGVIVHKIYASCVTVIHFGFQSVFTEWFLVYYGGSYYCSTRWKSIGLAVNTKELKERFRKSVDSKNRTVMRDVREGRKKL